MKNNKGFTLIELLATISLLAILMLIAVPNIIGVVNKNKNNTYIEDAKKLVSLAEYKIRSDSKYKPPSGNSYCFTMDFLGTGDFDTTAPNGGKYQATKSYVKATKKSDGTIQYSVVLVEFNNGKFIGILEETESTKLYQDDTSGLIKTISNQNTNTPDCFGNKTYS